VSLSAIRGVLQSILGKVLVNVLGGVLESVLRAYLGGLSSRLEMSHRVQLGLYLRAWSGVCLRVS